MALSDDARTLVSDMRDTVWVVDNENDTLEDLIERMERVKHQRLLVPATFRIAETIPDRYVSMHLRRNLMMMYKEVINNINRHARASHVEIEIYWKHQRFGFSVSDDGIGFKLSDVERGHGLKSLKDRAIALDGQLDLRSEPGTGTMVRFTVKMA
jgi:signal transduction histidine kinase